MELSQLAGGSGVPEHRRRNQQVIASGLSLLHSAHFPGLYSSAIRIHAIEQCCEALRHHYPATDHDVAPLPALLQFESPMLKLVFSGCTIRTLETAMCACKHLRDALLSVAAALEQGDVRRCGYA